MLPQSRYSQTPSSPVAHPTPAPLPPTESLERTGLAGPRPLLLGSARNTTQSSADSSTSSPSSCLSTSRTTRSPTVLAARWSSYTPPLSPAPSFEPSLASEVEMLKAQLAASEATVKQLTKEKYEAVDAARRFCKKWETVQAELEKLKASALDEDDATPEVAPTSEGVSTAGLTTQLPAKNLESESASCGPPFELKDPQYQQTQGSKEKAEETLVVSPSSEVVSVAGSTNKLRLPKIRIIPPAPSDAESEPVLDSSPVTTATLSSFATSNYLSPPPRFHSHPTRSQSPQLGNTRGHSQSTPPPVNPQSTPPPVEHETTRSTNPGSTPQASRQKSFNRLGLRVSVPHPIRWLKARRQRELIDLEDPLSETPGRKVHNARMRLLQAQANGPAHSRPSFNLASAADLESSMIRVSMTTNRPRTESSSANWQASNPPQVQIPSDFLRRSANEIGGESRTAVESGMRSSPLGLFAPSSSCQVTPPEEVGEPQPTKRTGLRKLFKKGRSVISRFV